MKITYATTFALTMLAAAASAEEPGTPTAEKACAAMERRIMAEILSIKAEVEEMAADESTTEGGGGGGMISFRHRGPSGRKSLRGLIEPASEDMPEEFLSPSAEHSDGRGVSGAAGLAAVIGKP